jgi:O-antigen/teichoic acid export membrane protein
MEDKAVRGIPWALLTYAVTRGLTFATTLVLARLLTPHDFGLVVLATLVLGVLTLFRDLGLGGALVVRQDFDERAKGTILVLLAALGLITATVAAGLSPVVALAFDEPRLAGVAAAMAPIIALGGLAWFYETLLQLELEFPRRLAAYVLYGATFATVGVTLAGLGVGVWALVGAHLSASAVLTAALIALAPYRVRPAFDRRAARDAIATGRGFVAQGGLAFIQSSAGFVVVGRVLGAGALGFYSLAYRASELPYLAIADSVAKVTFPGFARMRHRNEDITAAFLSTLRLVALVAAPIGILLSAAADPLTRAVLGPRWVPMIPALTLLGLWGALRPLLGTLGWLLNSVGAAALLAKISALLLLGLVPALVIAAEVGGIREVAAVMVAEALISVCVLAAFAAWTAGVPLHDQWRALRGTVAACAGMWVTTWATAAAVPDGGAWLQLAASVAAGLLAYGALLAAFDPLLPRQAFHGATLLLQRGSAGTAGAG